MLKLLNNIFATRQSQTVPTHSQHVGNFNHCSTVCPHKKGILMAWYSGSGECRDDQHVCLIFIKGNKKSEILHLDHKTGNPVLWSIDNNKAVLLWSRFEDIENITNLADRWKYCSIWMQQVEYNDKSIILLGNPKQLTAPESHLLGRCNPIWHNDELILPLYDELKGCGVIYAGDGWELERRGNIGSGIIQPTLWSHNDTIHSLSRNFKNKKLLSQYAYSQDGGFSWSNPVDSSLSNNNSSLCTINYNDSTIVVWNNTIGKRREFLSMGNIRNTESIKHIPFYLLDKYGAYPSICIDDYGRLVVSYTHARKIKVHILSGGYIRHAKKKSYQSERRQSRGRNSTHRT